MFQSLSVKIHTPHCGRYCNLDPLLNNATLLTPWCRVLLEKLTGLQLVKKFPAFYGIPRFITALTSFRHLSLSWASPVQSTCPHPTSWRSILILHTYLRLGLPSGLFPSGIIIHLLFGNFLKISLSLFFNVCCLLYRVASSTPRTLVRLLGVLLHLRR